MFRNRSSRAVLVLAAVTATAALTATAAVAAKPTAGTGTPGGQSIGDPYYPTDGNTGYEVDHYNLRLRYSPGSDELSGSATILATTTKALSSFSFDFGMHADSVLVDSAPAEFHHSGTKLVIDPKRGHAEGQQMTVVVRYHGKQSTVERDGHKLWVATEKGALAANEPHIAAYWYPVNDHPLDKATYDVSVAVPDGTKVLSNGSFEGKDKRLPGMTQAASTSSRTPSTAEERWRCRHSGPGWATAPSLARCGTGPRPTEAATARSSSSSR